MKFKGVLNGLKYKKPCANFPRNWVEIEVPVKANGFIKTGLYEDLGKYLIIIDIDGWNPEFFDWIVSALGETYAVSTGSGGVHLYYLVDKEIHNTQKRSMSDFVREFDGIKHVDIRGMGGIVFAEGCKFIEHPMPYKLYKFESVPERQVRYIDYKKVEEIRKNIYKKKIQKQKTTETKRDKNYPEMRAYFRKMLHGQFIINHEVQDETGMAEFLYWAAFWRECISLGYNIEKIMNVLDQTQPEFDRQTTVTQLKSLNFRNKRPSRVFYYDLFPEAKKKLTGDLLFDMDELEEKVSKISRRFDILMKDLSIIKYKNNIKELGEKRANKNN